MNESALYAVAGVPVAHSLSPALFNAAFRAHFIPARYTRVAAADASALMHLADTLGLSGMNVTAPFKVSLFDHVSDADRTARAAGALNTVSFNSKRRYATNTDVAGIAGTLERAGVPISGSRALVVGSGGAARAACVALQSCGVESLTIANRTFERAQMLADLVHAQAVSFGELPLYLPHMDLLISCVPRGAFSAIDTLNPHACILDAAYPASPLKTAAEAHGIAYLSGQQWLLAQAEAAFRWFFGIDPPPAMSDALTQATPHRTNKIALIGHMGAGKSSVAHALAGYRQVPVIDIDDRVTHHAGMSIAAIFATHGEARFRELERRELNRALNDPYGCIIACGGGILEDAFNRELITRLSFPVWLHASPDTLALRSAGTARPLGPDSNRVDFDARLNARTPAFREIAQLIISTESGTAEENAKVLDASLG